MAAKQRTHYAVVEAVQGGSEGATNHLSHHGGAANATACVEAFQ